MKTHETINWTTTRALVTGASRGLGLALARGIAARGGQVVLVARGQADLDSAVAGMVAAGGAAFGLVADVGAGGAAPSIAARATALLGGVDLLIHDASTLGPVPLRELADLDAPALDAVFQVNGLGPQRLTNALMGAMQRQGRGTVVAISSDAAVEACPTWGAHGASKAAMDHLLRPVRLSEVQTPYAGCPWAIEMPSTGRPLRWPLLRALADSGVRLAWLTEASGLSATGDPDLDARLPLAERYEIPATTVVAVCEARRRGGRVIAAGTSVVRALEASVGRSGRGRATLRLSRGFFRPRSTDY